MDKRAEEADGGGGLVSMNASPSKSPSTTWWVTCLVAVSVMYVLSFGPFSRLMVEGWVPVEAERFFEVIYTPYLWLYDETPLSEILRGYERWCLGSKAARCG